MKTTSALAAVIVVTAFLGQSTLGQDGPVQRDSRVFRVDFLTTAPEFGDELFDVQPGLSGSIQDSYERLSIDVSDDEEDEGLAISWIDEDLLESVVQELIAEDSWSNTRNRLWFDGAYLGITQTPEVIETIAAFLGELEARYSRLPRIEVALVPLTALDEAQAGWRESTSFGLEGDALERAITAAGPSAVLVSGLAHAGVPRQLRAAAAERHVVDHEVNQTGVTPVINAVVQSTPDGSVAKVTVLRAGSRFRVDLRVGQTDLLGVHERRPTPAGEIELLERRSTALETSLLVPAGRTVVAGFLDSNVGGVAGDDRRAPTRAAVLLRVRETAAKPETQRRRGVPAHVDFSALAVDLPDWSLFSDTWADDSYDSPPFSDRREDTTPRLIGRAELDAAVRATWPLAGGQERGVMTSKACFLALDEKEVARTRETVKRLLAENARVVQIDVQQLSVEHSTLTELGGVGSLVDPKALDAAGVIPRFCLSVTAFAGLRVAVGSSLSRGYIAGIEHVSGGTDTSIVEVGDLVTTEKGGGVVLDAEAALVPGTPWVQLQLDGAVASYPRFERQTRERADERVQPVAAEGSAPASEETPEGAGLEATGEWIAIDLPDQQVDLIRHSVTLPLGRSMVLSALPDSEAPGRVLVLIVGVREIALPKD